MNIVEALGLSVLGLLIVFAVLLLLMLVIYILAATLGRKNAPSKPAAETAAATAGKPAVKPAVAPGSAGEVCMFDVPDRDAAMIMAIVADKLDAPLNELRFLSIKEVTDNEI